MLGGKFLYLRNVQCLKQEISTPPCSHTLQIDLREAYHAETCFEKLCAFAADDSESDSPLQALLQCDFVELLKYFASGEYRKKAKVESKKSECEERRLLKSLLAHDLQVCR